MALQVKRAGPEDYGTYIKALIVGEPGAGKTRSASTWPGVLYANAEGGQLSVTDRRPASVDIDTTSTLTELHSALKQSPEVREKMLGTDVQTVVVDTLDEIARLFIRERLQHEHKESMAIQDWGWLGDRLRDFVRGWRNLDMNVLFLVHVKAQEDSETGRVTYKPSIQGAMGDELAAYVDLALLLRARPTVTVVKGENVRVITRFMQTYPDAQFPWVKDRSGRLPMEFPINMNDDYARLRAAIFGAEAKAPEAVMAPPAPVRVEPSTKPGGPRKPPPPPVQAPPVGPDGPEPEAVAPPEPEAVGGAPEIPLGSEVGPAVVAPEAEPTTVGPEPSVDNPPGGPPGNMPSMAGLARPEVPPGDVSTLRSDFVPEVQPETEPAAQPTPEQIEAAPPVVPVEAPPAQHAPPAEVAEANGSGGLKEWQICESCGNEIETKDHGDLSFIRFKQRLCRSCFAERKKAKV